MAAYDVKVLIEKMKDKGLPVLEEMAKDVEESLCEWLSESAIESENKIDDVATPLVLAAIKPIIDAQIAKIDGK